MHSLYFIQIFFKVYDHILYLYSQLLINFETDKSEITI